MSKNPFQGKMLSGKSVVIGEIRPLTREDLAEVMNTKRLSKGAVARLRDSHHRVARLIASGVRPYDEVARRSGFSLGRVRQLAIDPAFLELIASYRGHVDEAFIRSQDDYFELATSNMVKAEQMIAQKLDAAEEEGELLPTRDLLAISRDAADRFGYGKKTTNLNVNVDFADKLEKAIARTRTVSSPSISPGAQAGPPASLVLRRL